MRSISRSVLSLLFCAGLAGCSLAQMNNPNNGVYSLAKVSMPVSAYTGASFDSRLSVLKNGATLASVGGSFTAAAYTDSLCAEAAPNPFTVLSAAITEGIGVLSASYDWHVAHLEGDLYFNATTNYGSLCMGPVRIIRKFTAGAHEGYTTFGPTGAAGGTLNNLNDVGNSVRVDSSGRIVIAGQSKDGGGITHMAIWRFTADGLPDTSFSEDGAVIFGSGGIGAAGGAGGNFSDSGVSLQIDSSGRYVVAGQSKNNSGKNEMAIWRYNSDGTPDTSFGGDGAITSGTTGAAGGSGATLYDGAKALLIDSSGRYVIAGSSMNTIGAVEAALWRVNPDGTLDTTFGGDGAVSYGSTVAGGMSDGVYSLQVDHLGRLVMCGRSKNGSNAYEMALWRFDAAGTPDTTFGGDGAVTFGDPGAAGGSGGNLWDYSQSLVLDSSGKYVVFGGSDNNSGESQVAIWRYNTDGTPDTSFGGDGAVTSGTTAAAGGSVSDFAQTGAIDSSGRLLVFGGSSNLAGDTRLVIWRFNPDGTRDVSFGSDGDVVLDGSIAGAPSGSGYDLAYGIAIDSVGRYVIVGSSKNSALSRYEMSVVRYLDTGELDK